MSFVVFDDILDRVDLTLVKLAEPSWEEDVGQLID